MSPRKRTDPRIAALIEEAVVDCYDESEQLYGLLNMLDEYLKTPFTACVVGVEVTVVGFDHGPERDIVAKVRRDGRSYRVNVTALEWPEEPPAGGDAVEAYRAWVAGDW